MRSIQFYRIRLGAFLKDYVRLYFVLYFKFDYRLPIQISATHGAENHRCELPLLFQQRVVRYSGR